MSCNQNHEEITSKFCPECGAKRIVSIEDGIAEQLSEIVLEVLDESGFNIFARGIDKQLMLFVKKIFDKKIDIPDGMKFVIVGNHPYRIFSFKKVVKTYPFLTEDIINNFYVIIDDYKSPTLETTDFAKMLPFLFANGECKDGKYFNKAFEAIKQLLESDEFKKSGCSEHDIIVWKYDVMYKSVQKTLDSFQGADKKLVRFILDQHIKKYIH